MIDKVKVACGLKEVAEGQPWQAVFALCEETMYPVTVGDAEERGMAARTRGPTRRAGNTKEADGKAKMEGEAESDEDTRRGAQEAGQSWHTDSDSGTDSDSDS